MLGEQTGSGDIADAAAIVNTLNFAATRSGVSGSMTVPVIVVRIRQLVVCGWMSCSPREALTGQSCRIVIYPHATGGSLTMCSGSTGAEYAATALADGVIVFYI
jgi:hypothetical protein